VSLTTTVSWRSSRCRSQWCRVISVWQLRQIVIRFCASLISGRLEPPSLAR
jgi:hypothetical protein